MYDEQLRWPRAAWGVLAAVALLPIAVFVVGLRDGRSVALLPLLGVIALVGGITVIFRRLHIVVDETALTVGFGPFRDRLPRERIAACDAITYHWLEYGGWGIRANLRHPRQRSKLYNVPGDGGQAVQVVLDDGRRVLFSSHDPAVVCRLLPDHHSDGGHSTYG
jgi:hypothetical protein